MQGGYRGYNHDIPQCSNPLMQMTIKDIYMKKTTALNILKGSLYVIAIAIAVGAIMYNKAHLYTAALIFAFGMNLELPEED